MPKRQRDYKAEYARRTARAKREGFTGYAQKRKVTGHIRQMIEHFNQRIDTEGFDFETMFDSDDPEYWIWFRVNYGQGVQTA